MFSDRVHVTEPKSYYGFTALTGDFDNDGWPDIFRGLRFPASLLLPQPRWKRVSKRSASAPVWPTNEDGREQAGMGAAAADSMAMACWTSSRQIFPTTRTPFTRMQAGTILRTTPSDQAWRSTPDILDGAPRSIDFDNDGWKDLIVANGHVYPKLTPAIPLRSTRNSGCSIGTRGDGQFFDLSSQGGPGIAASHSSRGLAVGDLDNDGNEEIVIVNMSEGPTLLKNFGPRTGNSLLVRAFVSGRDAIGARVTVTSNGRKQVDEVRSGGSFISQNDFRLHFGISNAKTADLSVRWLDGKLETFPGSRRVKS